MNELRAEIPQFHFNLIGLHLTNDFSFLWVREVGEGKLLYIGECENLAVWRFYSKWIQCNA